MKKVVDIYKKSGMISEGYICWKVRRNSCERFDG